jgi:hypothetical protein
LLASVFVTAQQYIFGQYFVNSSAIFRRDRCERVGGWIEERSTNQPTPKEFDMNLTDPNHPTTTRANDGDFRPERPTERLTARETKPSPRTTELWIAIIGVAVLAVVYNASRDASLDLFRACLLGTIITAAYIVSRGFAKAGSHDDEYHVGEYEGRR